ncbi:MAG: hypothetical protein ACRD1P_11870 [Thermoanaerobaculia bacterium]
MKTKAIDFDTSDYASNHGREPRGRGGWAFSLVNPRRGDYLDHVIWTPSMTYGDAKAWVKAHVRERGIELDCDTLWVCS